MPSLARALAAACLAALLPLLGLAEDAKPKRFVPARFGDGPESLLRTIACPRAPEPDRAVVVFCQVEIDSSGLPRRLTSYCAEGSLRTPYSEAATAAARRARYLPASVDGVPVPVYASFRLVFRGIDSACKIAAIANLGGELAEAGLDYIAPQEILLQGSWYLRASAVLNPGGRGGTSRPLGPLFTMSVAVAEDGSASAGRIERNFGATRTEARSAIQAIERARFIPGFRGGKPTAMRYVELLFLRIPH
jgi:hypothetical protein